MNSILFCAVILALGLCCRAEEEGEMPACMKEWKELHDKIKVQICKPDTCEDKTIAALIECKSILAGQADKMENVHKMGAKLYEKCGTPNEGNVKGYSKVDLTNAEHKKVLMSYCSDTMETCIRDTIKEFKESHPDHKPDESKRPKLTDQEKADLHKCMKKAAGLPE